MKGLAQLYYLLVSHKCDDKQRVSMEWNGNDFSEFFCVLRGSFMPSLVDDF